MKQSIKVLTAFVVILFCGAALAGAIPTEWQNSRVLNGAYGEHCGEAKEGTAQLKCSKADKAGYAEVSLTITLFGGTVRRYNPVRVDVTQCDIVEVRWHAQEYRVKIMGNEFFGEPIYSDVRPACSPDAVWSVKQVFLGAETFDGYVVAADGTVAGTVQIKAGKPNKKTGVSKLTAAVTMLGEKKLSIKGETIDGTATMTAKDGRVLEVNLASDAMRGTFDGKDITISRNIFTAKDDESKSAAASVLAKVQGVYVASLLGNGGVGALSVDVKAKGKVKVSGNLADGTKVSANAQLIANQDGSCAIPVVYAKNGVSFAMVIAVASDGTVSANGYDTSKYGEVIIAKHSASAPDSVFVFSIDTESIAESFAGVAEINAALLPDGVEVAQKKGKWTVPKAGKVKYKNGAWDISGENPSALKLSYKSKTGAFTGSFNVYGLVNGKMKKYSVKVSGVVVNGVGYGTASLKKPAASWIVTMEPYERPSLPDWAAGMYAGQVLNWCNDDGDWWTGNAQLQVAKDGTVSGGIVFSDGARGAPDSQSAKVVSASEQEVELLVYFKWWNEEGKFESTSWSDIVIKKTASGIALEYSDMQEDLAYAERCPVEGTLGKAVR
jgi:hypothetical protein